MQAFEFPKLELNQWKETRNSLHKICKVMGAVRSEFTQKQKHWYHVNIRPGIIGWTTTTLHYKHYTIFQLDFDFKNHALLIQNYLGDQEHIQITRQTVGEFATKTGLAVEKICGKKPSLTNDLMSDTSDLVYDKSHANNYYKAFLEISIVLKAFKHSLNEETSEVQLWPDHFDLALLWFSGNKVSGIDPVDEEHSDEQMNFGFSTGDETVPEPYFYITAYPMPKLMNAKSVDRPVYWNDSGFKGFVINYNDVIQNNDPAQYLFDTLSIIHTKCSNLMNKS